MDCKKPVELQPGTKYKETSPGHTQIYLDQNHLQNELII